MIFLTSCVWLTSGTALVSRRLHSVTRFTFQCGMKHYFVSELIIIAMNTQHTECIRESPDKYKIIRAFSYVLWKGTNWPWSRFNAKVQRSTRLLLLCLNGERMYNGNRCV